MPISNSVNRRIQDYGNRMQDANNARLKCQQQPECCSPGINLTDTWTPSDGYWGAGSKNPIIDPKHFQPQPRIRDNGFDRPY